VHFQDGSLVQKGDLLFSIDPRSFESRSRLEVATTALDLAKQEFQRAEWLLKSNAVAETVFDQRRRGNNRPRLRISISSIVVAG
jgi:multidrug resistance efflux pump